MGRIKVTELETYYEDNRDYKKHSTYGGLYFNNSVKVENLVIELINYKEYYSHGKVRSYEFNILSDLRDTGINYNGNTHIEYWRRSTDYKTLFYKEIQKCNIGTKFIVSAIVDKTITGSSNANLWRIIRYKKL